MTRTLSHSEISTALDCEYRWDYSYGGHRVGTALRPKAVAPLLRGGRAWGAGVATYCAEILRTDALPMGHLAIDASLEEDAERQRQYGVHDVDEHAELTGRLHRMLDSYAEWTEPMPVDRLEHRLEVPIPARGEPGRPSSRYRFEGYLDCVHADDENREWLVDFKFRGQLSRAETLMRAPQFRRYAWAAREQLGLNPVGFIVDEWLNDEPKPARLVKGKGGMVPSHDAHQKCLPEDYVRTCEAFDVLPRPDVVDALRARRWFQRTPILFRPDELDEVGASLVSSAQLIRDLDSGARAPIPNPSQFRCPGCPYNDVCPESDTDLVDMLFERTAPKRERMAA